MTGVPLGLSANEIWGQRVAQLAPSDGLALYTAGVTEVGNEQASALTRTGS